MSATITRSIIRPLLRPAVRITPINTSPSRYFRSTAVTMGVHNINSKQDFYKVIAGEEEVTLAAESKLAPKKVVILDCFATWCGPCKAISPQFVKWSDEEAYQGINFVKIDVDEVPDLSQELGIRAMPTFMIFHNGEKAEEIVGANPPAIKKALDKYAALL